MVRSGQADAQLRKVVYIKHLWFSISLVLLQIRRLRMWQRDKRPPAIGRGT